MKARWLALPTVLWLLAALALPSSALAKREESYPYPFLRVWTATVRLLRVDFECPITEKDKDDGYFLFEYPDHGKSFPGSVEFVTTKENGLERVRVVIQIPAMPSTVEAMMLDRLGRKLQQEFGAPKEAPTPPSTGNAPKSDAAAKEKPKSDASSKKPPSGSNG